MMIKTHMDSPRLFAAFHAGLLARRTAPLVRALVPVVFGAAALVLAFEPVRWLVNTWLEPAYDSKGFYVFAAFAALFAWSAASPRQTPQIPQQKRLALSLLAITALVRLAGQVLAVNVIGALALVMDVYALGLLLGLKHRRRALSPGWLAVAFAFSLPLERIAQRTIGYGLQSLSSARSILLLFLCLALLAALARPGLKQALVGGALTLVAGLLANMVRISLLATGIARPQFFLGADVMAQPWHDLVGLLTLAAGALPLLIWAGKVSRSHLAPTIDERCRHFIPDRLLRDGWWLQEPAQKSAQKSIWASALLSAFAFLALAVVIVNLPRKALDVTRRSMAIELPGQIAGPIQDLQAVQRENQPPRKAGSSSVSGVIPASEKADSWVR